MLIILLFFGLFFNDYKPAPYLPIVNKITNKFIDETPNKYGLNFIGGGGRLMHDVTDIGIHCLSKKKYTVNEARRIYVKMAERLIAMVNQNEEIQPYLHKRPFDIEGVDLIISFINEDGSRPDPRYVAYVKRDKDIIIYKEVRPNNRFLCQIFHEEPYAEALKIIQEEDAKGLYK